MGGTDGAWQGDDAQTIARIYEHALKGRPVNLFERDLDQKDAREYALDHTRDWPGATIEAEVLRDVILAAAADPETHAKGITIQGLSVKGDLDLYNVSLSFPLRFQYCRLEGRILLGHARLETLEVTQCSLAGLSGRGAVFGGNLKMHYSASKGPIVLEGANIGGWADFDGMHMLTGGAARAAYQGSGGLPAELIPRHSEENIYALLLSVARIGNDLRLSNVQALGPIRMEELVVGKRLFLDRARIGVPAPDGEVERNSSHGADLPEVALKAGGMTVRGHAALTESQFFGQVRFTGAHISGSLRLFGARIHGRNNRSLMLDRAVIEGDLLFGNSKPFNAPGTDDDDDPEVQMRRNEAVEEPTVMLGAVRMRKALVKGDLNLSETRLNARGYPNGFALRVTGAEIEGELICIRLKAKGTVDFANAAVRRKVRIYSSCFEKAPTTRRELNAAFEANHLQVSSDFVIQNCTFNGPLYLQDANIQGTLYLTGSHFDGTDTKADQHQMALAAERLHIGANIQITDYRNGADKKPSDENTPDDETSNDENPAPDVTQPGGDDTPNGTKSMVRSCRFDGGVSLADAHVSGALIVLGGEFIGLEEEKAKASQFSLMLVHGEAFHAGGIAVERSIRLSGNGIYRGTVNFEEATIEDEIHIEQVVLVGGRRNQSLRFSLGEIRGSLFLGSRIACLDPAVVEQFKQDHECPELMPSGRQISVLSFGQVNLSGCRLDGFLALQGLHIHNNHPAKDHYRGSETLSFNASLAEIGKDIYVHRAHRDDIQDTPGSMDPAELLKEPVTVTVIGPVDLGQAEIKGNLSLDRMLIYSRRAAGTASSTEGGKGKGPRGDDGVALMAAGMKVRRNVYLGPDFATKGEAEFARAEVGQTFLSEGRHEADQPPEKQFRPGSGKALDCQGIQVGENVELLCPFTAKGKVDFTQAQIYSTFRCKGAHIAVTVEPSQCSRPEPRRAKALELPGATIGRKVILDKKSRFAGHVDLTAARIDADLEFWRENFLSPKAEDGESVSSVKPECMASRMKVSGTLFCGVTSNGINNEGTGTSTPSYILDLTDTSVRILWDHPSAWPDNQDLRLSGFTYERIAEGAPTDPGSRTDWLSRHAPADGQVDSQPYDQLVQVLRDQGRPAEAEDVDVAKYWKRTKHKSWPAWFYWTLFGRTMRFGYRPSQLIGVMALFIVLGSVLFGIADRTIVDVPPAVRAELAEASDTKPSQIPSKSRCMVPADAEFFFGRSEPDNTSTPNDYPAFNTLHFSVDLIIPIIDLRQSNYWIVASLPGCRGPSLLPIFTWNEDISTWLTKDNQSIVGSFKVGPLSVGIRHTANWINWIKIYEAIHIVLGWVFASLFAVLITGLIQPRRDT